jgi:hypothetical protein
MLQVHNPHMSYLRGWLAGGQEVDLHVLPWQQQLPPWQVPLPQLCSLVRQLPRREAAVASMVAEPRWILECMGQHQQVGEWKGRPLTR